MKCKPPDNTDAETSNTIIRREESSERQVGTGTNDIIDRCLELGLRKPEFRQDENFTMVMWRKGQDEDTGKGTSSTSNSTSNSTSGSISNQVLRLVAILNGEMTVREMMDVLGLRSRPMFFNYYLAPALKAGVIAMTQPDSPRSPTQKYYLTESGKSLIEKN